MTDEPRGPDSVFLDEVAAAERHHRESRCRCGTKARLVGSDGPDLDLLVAGWRCAEALDRAVFSGMDSTALADEVLRVLTRYRACRTPPEPAVRR